MAKFRSKGSGKELDIFVSIPFLNMNLWDNPIILASEVETTEDIPKNTFFSWILACLGYLIPLLAATSAIPLDQEDWEDGDVLWGKRWEVEVVDKKIV